MKSYVIYKYSLLNTIYNLKKIWRGLKYTLTSFPLFVSFSTPLHFLTALGLMSHLITLYD
jgi:hypothetical protein